MDTYYYTDLPFGWFNYNASASVIYLNLVTIDMKHFKTPDLAKEQGGPVVVKVMDSEENV